MTELKELIAIEDWEKVWKHSLDKPTIILKHSTTCPTSARAFKQYKSFIGSTDAIDCYLVKVIQNRDVSNHIQADTNVKHESPQIFLIRNMDVLWHTSHGKITKKNIEKAIQVNI